MDFALIKYPGQTTSVWAHISEVFGRHPAPADQDACALQDIKTEFPVRTYVLTHSWSSHAYAVTNFYPADDLDDYFQ